jgi:gliding motility-associated-like protein
MKHFFLLFILSQFISFGYTQTGPVAVNGTVTVHENSVDTIHITAFVTDVNGGALTVTTFLQQVVNGFSQIENNNEVVYTPNRNFFGFDSFAYVVCDTFNKCDSPKVVIHVLGSNFTPVVVNDSYTFADTVSSDTLNVLANDRDPGNDTLYIASVKDLDSSNNLGELTIAPDDSLVFLHTPLTCGTKVFQYVACNFGKCDSATITISVTCPANIFLPQGFSPNGDGKNDLLVFTGLEYFSPSSLKVFNRYGTTVYQSDDYQNNWDGTDSNSHKPLPDGTYFYVLQLSNGRTYNNYLILNR